jgi:IS30 family transposase
MVCYLSHRQHCSDIIAFQYPISVFAEIYLLFSFHRKFPRDNDIRFTTYHNLFPADSFERKESGTRKHSKGIQWSSLQIDAAWSIAARYRPQAPFRSNFRDWGCSLSAESKPTTAFALTLLQRRLRVMQLPLLNKAERTVQTISSEKSQLL